MTVAVVHRVSVFPLQIPLRRTVRHALSSRSMADPVIVGVELRDGTVGYGETLPRPYVTGETVESVRRSLEEVFIPWLVDFHPSSFSEALEAIEALPWQEKTGRPASAARAAVELSLLDATMRFFRRDMDAVAGWSGLPQFGKPGSLRRIRYSGVLATDDVGRMRRQLRAMWWGGLRHFKIKVASPGDRSRVEAAARYLRRALARGQASIRLDANGAWSADEARDWLGSLGDLPIVGIEQPLARGCEDELPKLKDSTRLAFIHDESLITREDAERLIRLHVADVFSIRLSKCGGLLPALRLAGVARRAGVGVQLGCMVGETGILSAAGVRFLEVCPDVTWAEGCYGRLLLADDITKKTLRFTYGGKPPRLPGAGLGVEVCTDALDRLCADHARVVHL